MQDIHKSRLARLAIALLDASKGDRVTAPSGKAYLFHMQVYSMTARGDNLRPAQVHECGTTCCFIGYAPIVFADELGADMPDRWGPLCDWVIGPEAIPYAPLRAFLFGAHWPNDPFQAARRALAVCREDAGVVHEKTLRCYEHMSDAEVHKYLQEFVLP